MIAPSLSFQRSQDIRRSRDDSVNTNPRAASILSRIERIARHILAILTVLFTMGTILLNYHYSDLVNTEGTAIRILCNMLFPCLDSQLLAEDSFSVEQHGEDPIEKADHAGIIVMQPPESQARPDQTGYTTSSSAMGPEISGVKDEKGTDAPMTSGPDSGSRKLSLEYGGWWDISRLAECGYHLAYQFPELMPPRLDRVNFNNLTDCVLQDLHLSRSSLDQGPQAECCVHNTEYTQFLPEVGRNCQGKTVFAYFVIIPLRPMGGASVAQQLQNSGNHWTLVVVDTKKRSVSYFDSLATGGPVAAIHSTLRNLSCLLGRGITDENGSPTPFTLNVCVPQPLQQDGWTCGLWATFFLIHYLQNPGKAVRVTRKLDSTRFVTGYISKFFQNINAASHSGVQEIRRFFQEW